jgi:hypothetical protein
MKSKDNIHSHDNIENRSLKIQQLLGEKPPLIIRYGISIIFIALLAVIIVLCFIPYGNNTGESIASHIISSFALF